MALKTHGEAIHGSQTIEYTLWVNIWQRCTNPHHPRYADYGGRGITVDSCWRTFEGFLQDVGRRPSGAYSLGRINNNGDYTPENCRWETREQQAKNRRFKGVGFDYAAKKWRARIARNGKKYFVGNFKTEEEAIEARALFLENILGED